MEIADIDAFMELAAEHGVTFKVDTTQEGFHFAVGWPHTMAAKAREALQDWVDDNAQELSLTLGAMLIQVTDGKPGVTIIRPGKMN